MARRRFFKEVRDPVAYDRAHRAAAKVEVHHAERNRETVEGRKARDDRFAQRRFLAVARKLLRIRPLIDPAERIARLNLAPDLHEIAVDEHVDPIVRMHAEVVLAARTHIVVRLEVLLVDHLAALRAARPQRGIFGRQLVRAAQAQPVGHRHQEETSLPGIAGVPYDDAPLPRRRSRYSRESCLR
jgi:hypothetical protein